MFNLTLVCRCVNDHIPSNGDTLCHLLSFLSHLAELLSAFFTAQFTAQRFIAVRFPLSVFIEKKIHLVHYVIVALIIVLGCGYCSALVHSINYDHCHEEVGLSWFISDAFLSFLLPFTMITVLNLLIIFHLKKGFQNNQPFRFRPRQESESVPLNTRVTNSSSQEMTSNAQCRAKISKHTSMPSIRVRSFLSRESISSRFLMREILFLIRRDFLGKSITRFGTPAEKADLSSNKFNHVDDVTHQSCLFYL